MDGVHSVPKKAAIQSDWFDRNWKSDSRRRSGEFSQALPAGNPQHGNDPWMQRLLHGLAIALGAGCAVAALAAEPPKPVSKTQPAKSAAPQSVKAFLFPELRADEKYITPAADTVLTACEITMSWKGDSLK